jgi:nicotinate-nucleotide pyrophosphorylase (carboxylating)
MAATYGDIRHLLPGNYKRQITDWLEEDCPSLDYGGFVVGESEGEARLLGKSKVSTATAVKINQLPRSISSDTSRA